MALIASYLFDSFKNPLPWTDCRDDWDNCVPAGGRKESELGAPQASALSQLSNYTQYLDNGGDGHDNTTLQPGPKMMGSSEMYFM